MYMYSSILQTTFHYPVLLHSSTNRLFYEHHISSNNCQCYNVHNAVLLIFSDFQRDSSEVKRCSKYGHPCIARLDGLNRVILQHSEGIWYTSYHCLGDTILKLDWFDS